MQSWILLSRPIVQQPRPLSCGAGRGSPCERCRLAIMRIEMQGDDDVRVEPGRRTRLALSALRLHFRHVWFIDSCVIPMLILDVFHHEFMPVLAIICCVAILLSWFAECVALCCSRCLSFTNITVGCRRTPSHGFCSFYMRSC